MDFNAVVKGAIFNAEDFNNLVDQYNPRDIREEILEMLASIKVQVMRASNPSQEWLSKVKSLQIFGELRLSKLNELINNEDEQWQDLVKDLVEVLDSHRNTDIIAHWTTPTGQNLLQWYYKD